MYFFALYLIRYIISTLPPSSTKNIIHYANYEPASGFFIKKH